MKRTMETLGAGVVGGLAVAVVMGLMGSVRAPSDTIQAKRFEVLDAAGKVRIVLGVDDELRSGVRLYNASGGIGISASKSGPEVVMHDASGKPRIILGMAESGPGVWVYDASEKARIFLGENKSGHMIGILGASGKARVPRVSLHETESGSGVFVYGASGQPRIGMTKTESGSGVFVYDASGEPRIGLAVDSESGPAFQILDRQGAVLHQLP